MQDQRLPLRPGEPASEFTLPAANRAGSVSLADLRGRAFLIGFYRGLHCPFCRRQVVQLGAVQSVLNAVGIETLAVINTPVERARLYFRHRPTPVTLFSDPDCLTHRAFGVPHAVFLPDGSPEQSLDRAVSRHPGAIRAARINPTGELPAPTQPMEANIVLNALDGFRMEAADDAILGVPPDANGRAFPGRRRRHRPLGADRGPGRPGRLGTFLRLPEQLIAAAKQFGQ